MKAKQTRAIQNGVLIDSSSREVQMAIPSAMEMSVRITDWRRLYRSVRDLKSDGGGFLAAACAVWGVAGSAAVWLISIYSMTPSPAEAASLGYSKPIAWLSTLVLGVLGTVIFWFHRIRKTDAKSSVQGILGDMEDLHRSCFPNTSLEDDVPARPSTKASAGPNREKGGASKSEISRGNSGSGAVQTKTDPLPDFGDLIVGKQVRHPTFGEGKVLELGGKAGYETAVVDFPSVGRKKLMIKFANLHMI